MISLSFPASRSILRRVDRLAGRVVSALTGMAVLAAAGSSGCTRGSLATTTGPKPAQARFSLEDKQQVHVGETVEFDFILVNWEGRQIMEGVDEYAAMRIGAMRMETHADFEGHYTFTHTFDETVPGDVIVVRADAYRQRDARDYMEVFGEWVRADSPSERPDEHIAGDQVELDIYQTVIDEPIEVGTSELNPQSGALVLARREGGAKTVYVRTPNRHGFDLSRTATSGLYRLRYEPVATDVNVSGQTSYDFSVYDRAGRMYTVHGVLDTP